MPSDASRHHGAEGDDDDDVDGDSAGNDDVADNDEHRYVKLAWAFTLRLHHVWEQTM